MRLQISHETIYSLSDAARRSIQYLRLTPRADRCQRVESWSISGPEHLREWTDGYGNIVHLATESDSHDTLTIKVEGVVSTRDTAGVLQLDDGLPPDMFLRETELTRASDAIAAFARPFAAQLAQTGAIGALHAMMLAQADAVAFEPGHTTAATPAEAAFAKGKGVCQDHTHIFIAACRVIGLPCRYVSGYLAAGQGDIATHAWAEAYIADLGWVSFDAVNRQSATDSYVRLAIGPDYAAVAPVIGVRIGGGSEEISVAVQVRQIQ
ncbi:MAG: transglutaminase family protein [Rhodospirillaceae bacterium]|nr:transglutaminase family protein [Rhodospirillaceae bacterium]